MKIFRFAIAVLLATALAVRIGGADASVTNTTTVTGTLNFPGGGGGGGPAEVASISTNGGVNGVTSGSINTTGANLLIASVAWYPAAGADVTTAEFSDSKGNTWTQLNLAGVISSTLSANRLFWCVPSSVGSGHTFTVTETGSYASISVLALSGMSGAPFDQQAQNEQSATTTLQPGSITASQANAVLVTGLAFEASGTISINSSFEEPVTTNYSAGNGLGSSISWRIDTSATATNPTWTTTGSTSLAASMASFEY